MLSSVDLITRVVIYSSKKASSRSEPLTKTAKVIGKNNDLSRRIDIPVRNARDEIYELAHHVDPHVFEV